MKALILAASIAGLFLLSGCEGERHYHRGGGYGGAYEGWDRGYGHDDWREHNYDHRTDRWDRDHDWRYQNSPSPYQGYPNYNGYPNHY